jgi:threonyl-tRNA synthetase
MYARICRLWRVCTAANCVVSRLVLQASAEGFYCDAYYTDITLNESAFGRIQDKARKAVAAKQPFERIVVSRAEALECFAENKFKVEIIRELPDEAITLYRCGSLVDLCPGPHIPNTSFVKAFACLKVIPSFVKR